MLDMKKLTEKQLKALEFGRRGGYWHHTDQTRKLFSEQKRLNNPMRGKIGEMHPNWSRKKLSCLECGIDIFRPKCLLKRSKKTFCSLECKRNWFNKNKYNRPYYYYGKDWGKIRMKILERDNNKCVNCGSPDRLEIHHTDKWLNSKNNNLDNLITLCRKCHRKLEPRNIKRL